MKVTRRSALGALSTGVASLSGCAGWGYLTGGPGSYRLDGATATVREPSDGSLAVSAAIADPTATAADPAVMVLSIRNTGTETVRIVVGPPGPFGVLDDTSGADGLPLWSPTYERSEFFETAGYEIRSQADAAVEVSLTPDETAETRYTLPPTLATPGTTSLQNEYGRDRGLVVLDVEQEQGYAPLAIEASIDIT